MLNIKTRHLVQLPLSLLRKHIFEHLDLGRNRGMSQIPLEFRNYCTSSPNLFPKKKVKFEMQPLNHWSLTWNLKMMISKLRISFSLWADFQENHVKLQGFKGVFPQSSSTVFVVIWETLRPIRRLLAVTKNWFVSTSPAQKPSHFFSKNYIQSLKISC